MNSLTPDAAAALPGPPWLKKRRAEAAARFAADPMPTTEFEEWRYSPIDDLDLGRFSVEPAEPPTDGAIASPWPGLDGPTAAVVEIVNGHPVRVDVDPAVAADGVTVTVIGGDDEAGSLGRVADDAADHFTLLNDALARSPVLVDVPAGVTVERPIVVHHHVTGDGVASFPRIVVAIGRGADARVLDVSTSGPGETVFVCPVVELDVDSAGRLGYVNIQVLDPSAWQIGSQLARAERDATLVAASAGFGGGYARSRADTRLVGRGASGELLALYFGDHDQTLDYRTYQDHVAPDTTSNLLYKGVVDDEARSIYSGLIRVRPDARGTNAFQTNRNLKLSEHAWAESVPNLEIENNDVRCSHASAVGPVDEEQLFYLESRGVPTEVAERLIVAGFLDEVLTALPVPSVAPFLRSLVTDKLSRAGA